MKPRIKIGSTKVDSGVELTLFQHDKDFLLTADGDVLMSTRLRHSEEQLAVHALPAPARDSSVLVGGLGMGFTLRAALDRSADGARVVQVELVPAIVEWNNGPLGSRTDYPIKDSRVEVVVDDVLNVIRNGRGKFDAIILDVDNGPSAMVTPQNEQLYHQESLRSCHQALKPGGRMVVWSANEDGGFAKRLAANGFKVSVHRCKGSRGKGSPSHVIFVGQKA